MKTSIITEGEAEKLASQLANYWHEKGFNNVNFWVEPIKFKPEKSDKDVDYVAFSVRSNLINGLPPK